MKAYSDDVKCKFVITRGGLREGTSSRNVTFSCKYGRQRPSIATKRRPHTKKINCEAYVSFYARGENYYLVTFSSEHNHPNYEEKVSVWTTKNYDTRGDFVSFWGCQVKLQE